MAWIENQFGQILLVKQRRGSRLWSLPGGKVNKRETLVAAVKRELYEETKLKAASAELASIFERPERGNITFLFRITITGNGAVSPKAGEIETASFSSSLPENSTPSLSHFWGSLRLGDPRRVVLG